MFSSFLFYLVNLYDSLPSTKFDFCYCSFSSCFRCKVRLFSIFLVSWGWMYCYRLGEGNGNPLQYSCLENPTDGAAWRATVHGVAKSRTRLSNFTFVFHFHALEKAMATHSSVLAWRIPGTGEPGGLPSVGSHRVRHDWSDLAAAAATDLLLGLVLLHPIGFGSSCFLLSLVPRYFLISSLISSTIRGLFI